MLKIVNPEGGAPVAAANSEAVRKRGLAPGRCVLGLDLVHDVGCLSPFPDSLSRTTAPTSAILSVLMPVYNQRWTLDEAVRRVLSAPVPLEVELVIVDDGSADGSWERIVQLAAQEPRIKPTRHPRRRGRGAAIRTAIAQMTGDVAVVQDADLEYDSHELPGLLKPIMEGRADAVFGSRFKGSSGPTLPFWHSLFQKGLTLAANMVNNQGLTDVGTCYKMVRADILRQLCLKSDTDTIEPELACRLAQWGARIYEAPVSYYGGTPHDVKRSRVLDGLKAVWEMFRCRFLDPQFTDHSGFYILSSVSRATAYNRWTLRQVGDYLGQRVLEAGSGIGNLSSLLLSRQRLVLVDHEHMYCSMLERRFGRRANVRVDCADLTDGASFDRWRDESLDTIFCSNVLEHLECDVEVLQHFQHTLAPGGHCIIVVPAGRWLYTGIDRELGHCRRYTPDELRQKMIAAGFEIVFARRFGKLGSVGWAVSGHLLRRRHLSPRQMIWFDRLLPLVRLLDYVLPVPGMSLIMVGRKPDRDARRMAA